MPCPHTWNLDRRGSLRRPRRQCFLHQDRSRSWREKQEESYIGQGSIVGTRYDSRGFESLTHSHTGAPHLWGRSFFNTSADVESPEYGRIVFWNQAISYLFPNHDATKTYFKFWTVSNKMEGVWRFISYDTCLRVSNKNESVLLPMKSDTDHADHSS